MQQGHTFEAWLNKKMVGYVIAPNMYFAKQDAKKKYGPDVTVNWYMG